MNLKQFTENPEDSVTTITIGASYTKRFSMLKLFEKGEYQAFCDKYAEVLQDKFKNAEIEFDNSTYGDTFSFDETVPIVDMFVLAADIELAIEDCYVLTMQTYSKRPKIAIQI